MNAEKTREKKIVIVRGVGIGGGMPKICVSMTGTTVEALRAEAGALVNAGADLAEWRADWFSQFDDAAAVTSALTELRSCLGDLPLLVTFRTKAEGGNASITPEVYVRLYETVLNSGQADLIDLELFFDEAAVKQLIAKAKNCGVKTVISNHEFAKTPAITEIKRRLARMEAIGGDIVKAAVMPQCAADVAALLLATAESGAELGCPVVTMSMGGYGSVSRMAGEIFGSAITFGMVGKPSAPGQIAVGELRTLLTMFHSGLRSDRTGETAQ